jgi:protein pelota
LRLEKVMRDVEQRNGSVIVVSTEHEAGANLLALGGIVALLRFSVYRSVSK